MTVPADRRVALLGRATTLPRVARRLAALGWKVVRVPTIRTEPVRFRAPPAWTRRRPPADLWAVTSRAVADTVVRDHPDWRPALRSIPLVAAVGPRTAARLRELGFVVAVTAPEGGSDSLLRALGVVRGRTILYLRSDRAGPHLARRLRRRGATVIDRTVYRVRDAARAGTAAGDRLASIPVWTVASPSALAGFRRHVGAARFDARIADVRLFALGPRTARAARASGAHHVLAPSRSTEEGFTNLLETELGDARSRRRRPQ